MTTAVDALQARLTRLIRDVDSAGEILEGLPSTMLTRVRARVANDLKLSRNDLKKLRARCLDDTMQGSQVWGELAAIASDVDALSEECAVLALRFVPPEAQREVVERYCRFADALVDELAARTPVGPWSGFTVPGRFEHYLHLSRVIRIRTPAPTLWDLPVAAHELGHFVALSLTGRAAEVFEDLKTDVVSDADGWHWLNELFADAFGAYVVGPAYGFTSVVLGFDPADPFCGSETHPPADARVDAIVASLELLPKGSADTAAGVRTLWSEMLAAASPTRAEAEDEIAWSSRLADVLRELPVAAYAGWHEAERLAFDWSERPHGLQAGKKTQRADVVNAAWICRNEHPTGLMLDQIEARACEELRWM